MTPAVAQQKAPQNQATPQAAAQQNGTPGKIAKFTDTKYLADSNLTEDSNGKVGIGTTIPTSMLTVNGFIEMMGAGNGVKFADGTTQTTAGLAMVSRDNTLKGNGTVASLLGLPIPLHDSNQRAGSESIVAGERRSPGRLGESASHQG